MDPDIPTPRARPRPDHTLAQDAPRLPYSVPSQFRRSATPASPDWTELEVRCVSDSVDGPPAEVDVVNLDGHPYNLATEIKTSIAPTGDGVAEFGSVRLGLYQLEIVSPFGLTHRRELVLGPKRSHTPKIVCPARPLEKADLEVSTNLPAEQWPEHLAFRCVFEPLPIQLAGHDWHLVDRQVDVVVGIERAVREMVQLMKR